MAQLSPEEKWELKRFLSSTYIDNWLKCTAHQGTHFAVRVAIKSLIPICNKYNLTLEQVLEILEEDVIPRLKG